MIADPDLRQPKEAEKAKKAVKEMKAEKAMKEAEAKTMNANKKL